MINARKQIYLINYYDEKTGRVLRQDHGIGTFQISYENNSIRNSISTLITTTILKNGGKLIQEHDYNGHEIIRTLIVRSDSIESDNEKAHVENYIPIITKSMYNNNGELINRYYPSGNSNIWKFSEEENCPKNKGNLMSKESISYNKDKNLIITFEYELDFQQIISKTNARLKRIEYQYDKNGNIILIKYPEVGIQPLKVKNNKLREKLSLKKYTVKFEYNSAGQLINKINTDCSIETYRYFSENDPVGRNGNVSILDNQITKGGYLAIKIRDAEGIAIKNEFRYDVFGNPTTFIDGKENSFYLKYNVLGKIETVIGRGPFSHEIQYQFDEDYNLIEESKDFDHYIYDKESKTTRLNNSILIEKKNYNSLGNIIKRELITKEKEIVEKFIRNENEQITRIIQPQPLGTITDFEYDERNQLIKKICGVGSDQKSIFKYRYSLTGKLKRFTDAKNNFSQFQYDGFDRWIGFKNPAGTEKIIHLNETGFTNKIEYYGQPGLVDKMGNLKRTKNRLLDETIYFLDEWDRTYRIDRKWYDFAKGTSRGRTTWDKKLGYVSSLIEFADNGKPAALWSENNNLVTLKYDGLSRPIQIKNSLNEIITINYDHNNNVVNFKKINENSKELLNIQNQFDELDRVKQQKINNEAPKHWNYNALNYIINTIEKSGIEVKFIHDGLGRSIGNIYEVDLHDQNKQKVIRLREFNDNYLLAGYTNANGQKTTFQYDSNGRISCRLNPDGSGYLYNYDENDRILKVITPKGEEVSHFYDLMGRLEKREFFYKEKKINREIFRYDGKNRLVAVITDKSIQNWAYDSLSRVILERQGDKTVFYHHDGAGNLDKISYPGGNIVKRTFDINGNIKIISDHLNKNIASYYYQSDNKIEKIIYDNSINAMMEYDKHNRLVSIEYHRKDNYELIDGCQYEYDDSGRLLHEIHLDEGKQTGDRYFFDNANRIIKAQYEVEDVYDNNSKFQQEIVYDYFPEGLYKQRTVIDGNGKILKNVLNTITDLNNYETLDNYSFKYDENGNCIRQIEYTEKLTKNTTKNIQSIPNFLALRSINNFWEFEYDDQHRIIMATKLDKNGVILISIEFTYDADSRLIKKIEKDGNGNQTIYEYVYAGGILIQEYRNSILWKEYTYGSLKDLPINLKIYENGKIKDIAITFNGRGIVSSFHDLKTNKTIERLTTDVAGYTLIKQINGFDIPIQNREDHIGDIISSILISVGLNYGVRRDSKVFDSATRNSMQRGNSYHTGLGHIRNPRSFLGQHDQNLYADGESAHIIPGNHPGTLHDLQEHRMKFPLGDKTAVFENVQIGDKKQNFHKVGGNCDNDEHPGEVCDFSSMGEAHDYNTVASSLTPEEQEQREEDSEKSADDAGLVPADPDSDTEDGDEDSTDPDADNSDTNNTDPGNSNPQYAFVNPDNTDDSPYAQEIRFTTGNEKIDRILNSKGGIENLLDRKFWTNKDPINPAWTNGGSFVPNGPINLHNSGIIDPNPDENAYSTDFTGYTPRDSRIGGGNIDYDRDPREQGLFRGPTPGSTEHPI
ncbi:MAG TPA: hypothetical protein VK590_00590 [Saprospiraceae bacterium]|nr:hypothetical protein [Saprospiraceae bacterium]